MIFHEAFVKGWLLSQTFKFPRDVRLPGRRSPVSHCLFFLKGCNILIAQQPEGCKTHETCTQS